MILLPETAPPLSARRQLRRWQAELDGLASYRERVEAASATFKTRNTPRNPTFRSVREALTTMCSGAKRCGYCEDSAADEVEHIQPKNLYPELCFVWSNYLYACGPCNGPKGHDFALFHGPRRVVRNVARARNAPVVPPPAGEPVLLDPRREDPLQFLALDLLDTFLFSPFAAPGTEAFERAQYTIRVLRLNAREHLPVARAQAYTSYRARLKEYIAERDAGAPRSQLHRILLGIRAMDHPTVWAEMKRQHDIRSLRALFAKAPEALGW
jgi:uncharacterized protein (TIGR02646 family)